MKHNKKYGLGKQIISDLCVWFSTSLYLKCDGKLIDSFA